MKKLTTILLSIILILCFTTGCKDGQSIDNTEDNASNNESVVYYYDWTYYRTVESLLNRVDHVFTGEVVNIFFKVIDIKTAEIAPSSPKSENTDLELHTIYEIEPNKIYRGTNREKLYIRLEGGIPGYKEQEQFDEMRRAGIYREGYGIPVAEPSITFKIGDSRLFLSRTSFNPNMEYMVIPSIDQFAFEIGTGITSATVPNYNNIVKYFKDNKETE